MIKTLPLRPVLLLLSLYFIISVVGLHYHELALEEAQFFLFARDSDSLSALYHNMQYEGHPRLWCSLLFLIIHYITPGYAGMQALHLVIAMSTVFVFLRYAPFGLLSKILVIGGYYFLYEYDILSRSYALGILLLFICCVLMRRPAKNLVWIGLLLLLLCNTHLFFSFAAIGIFLYVSLDLFQQKRGLNFSFLLFSLLVLGGVLCTLIQGRIPAEDKLIPIEPGGWHTAKNISNACWAVIRGWLPIPKVFSENFWNSFWLDDNNIGVVIRTLLFLGCLVLPAVILKKNGKALLFYYTVISLLFIFFLIFPMVAARYFGIGYIAFLAACWMAGQQSAPLRISSGSPEAYPDFLAFQHIPNGQIRAFLRISLYGIFVVQVLTGIFAVAQDLGRPFSQAKNAVAYIKEHGLEEQEMVVDGYIAGPALSVYSGKKLFYLNIGQMGSWCIWRKSYFPHPPLTLEQEMPRAEGFLRGLDKFILVSSKPIDTTLTRSGDNHFNFTLLSGFPHSITSMENSYLYQATRKSGDPVSPGHPLGGNGRLF